MPEIGMPPSSGMNESSVPTGPGTIQPGAPGPASMQGGERAAVAYLETAVEMLDAAGEEAPALMGAVEQIKQVMAQILQQVMGGGGQEQPIQGQGGGPAYPPGM